MNNRNNSKKYSLKNNLLLFLSKLKFKSLNLSLPKQIVLLGSIIGFFSLFFPWIQNSQTGITWNSFYSLTGNIGYILIILFLILIYICLSTSHKEKLKLYSDLSLKNHYIIIISGLFVISFSIISLNFINGLNTFFQNSHYGKGVILSMTSGIIILIGGILLRREYFKDSSDIILNKLSENREKTKEEEIKNNMKLPF